MNVCSIVLIREFGVIDNSRLIIGKEYERGTKHKINNENYQIPSNARGNLIKRETHCLRAEVSGKYFEEFI